MSTVIPFKNLTDVPWTHTATLTFDSKALNAIKSNRIDEPARLAYIDFIRQAAIKLHLRIAAASVVTWDDERPHIHLLLVGKSKNGKTLNDCSKTTLEGIWKHGNAVVLPTHDIEGAVGYLKKNFEQGGTDFNISGAQMLKRWLCNA